MKEVANESGDPDVIDLDRRARPVGPGVEGAQWDEVRGCWERWDEAAGEWIVVGTGDRVPLPTLRPDDEMTTPERVELDADEGIDPDEGHIGGHHIIDLDRRPRPKSPGIPGAQWNEVVGRWEVWDPRKDRWVDARNHQQTR